MYRMIALDLDDTLLNEVGDVSRENIRAIEKAREEGVTIVLCSGRPSVGMNQIIDKLKLNKEGEYYISFNGALIRQCVDDRIVYKVGLEENILNSMIDHGRQHDLGMQLYINDEMLVEKYTQRTSRYESMVGIKAKVVDDLKAYTKEGALKLLMNDDNQRLRILYDEISSIYDDQLHMFFSRDHLLEFISYETNKGIAVIELAKRLGIEKDEIIAVGDSYNDLYMIEMVGLGVTVSNGREDVKSKSQYVTTRNNNQHAIEEVIEKFILHKEV